MRKHTLLCLCMLLALPFLLPTQAMGQSLETYCGACRDVRAHPMDFGNHAFNVVFAQAESDAATLLNATVTVSNSLGQRVPVYLSRVMEETGLSLGISPFFYYQVPFPSPFVQIAVQDPWGTLTTYQVLVTSEYLIVGDLDPILEPEPEPEPEAEEPQPISLNKSPGGLDLLGGYDASANYYGSPTFPYYDNRIGNE